MPEVADWFETDEPTVVWTPPKTHWQEDVYDAAIAIGTVIGIAVLLFALLVVVGISLVAFAGWVLGMTWGVPAVLTAVCLVVGR